MDKKEFDKQIRARIRTAFKEKDMTFYELALLTGLYNNTVYKITKGQVTPNLYHTLKIKKYLDFDIPDVS